jgi:hypothetical protein
VALEERGEPGFLARIHERLGWAHHRIRPPRGGKLIARLLGDIETSLSPGSRS